MKKGLLVLSCVALFSASPAQADPLLFSAVLTSAEVVDTGSPGVGLALVSYEPSQHLMDVNALFGGLTAPTTIAHIHCCVDPPGAAGVATPVPTFPGFPEGVTIGLYNESFDLSLPSSYSPGFLLASGGDPLAAELALTQGLASGRAYFNIHTTLFPGGEIRGFFAPVSSPDPIPEPTSFVLLGSGLLAAMGVRRWRQRNA